MKGRVIRTEEYWAIIKTVDGGTVEYHEGDGALSEGDEVEVTVTKSVPVDADDLDRKADNSLGGRKDK